MMMRLAIVVAAGAVVAAACSKKSATGPGVVCTQVAVPGVTITVVDSVTGSAVSPAGIWARVRENAYVDSSASPSTLNGVPGFSFAYERVGTYVATVHVPTYRDWNRAGVEVKKTDDGCHVIAVPLTAKMTKVASSN